MFQEFYTTYKIKSKFFGMEYKGLQSLALLTFLSSFSYDFPTGTFHLSHT